MVVVVGAAMEVGASVFRPYLLLHHRYLLPVRTPTLFRVINGERWKVRE